MTVHAQPDPSDRESLAGVVDRVTFHSPDSGFCVLRVLVRGHRERGLQFKATYLRASMPTTLLGIENHLRAA